MPALSHASLLDFGALSHFLVRLFFFAFVPVAGAVCPHCFGNLAGCDYDNDSTSCPYVKATTANVAAVAAAAGTTSLLTLSGVLAPRFLKAFTASTLSAILRLARRTAVTAFEVKATSKIDEIMHAITTGAIPFEDVRVSYERVHELRSTGFLPFSHVPAMQIGDDPTVHTQSQALLRWAGKQGGLYPAEHQLRIDCVTEIVDDLYTELIKVGYGAAMCRDPTSGRPMVPLTPAQRQQVAMSNSEILFPQRFAQLERMLAASSQGPYFAGEQLTIADLYFYVLSSAILSGAWEGNGAGPETLDGCERLLNIEKLVAAHPRVVAWNADHRGVERGGATPWFG